MVKSSSLKPWRPYRDSGSLETCLLLRRLETVFVGVFVEGVRIGHGGWDLEML
jgi:hypothetical protein